MTRKGNIARLEEHMTTDQIEEAKKAGEGMDG